MPIAVKCECECKCEYELPKAGCRFEDIVAIKHREDAASRCGAVGFSADFALRAS
ncbi:MAG: hypothetical protein ABFD83_01845 [Armatimonadota bacterium]